MKIAAVIGVASVALAVAGLANADPNTRQCVDLTIDQASRAAGLVPVGFSRALYYCELCGDQNPGPWQDITEVATLGVGAGPRSLKLNGRVVDIAYVYYWDSKTRTGRNMASDAGCPVHDVQRVLSVRQNSTVARQYRMTVVVNIMPTKADGSRWDPMGDPPDPMFSGDLWSGNVHVVKLPGQAYQKDTFQGTYEAIVTADDNSAVTFNVEDWDGMLTPDHIGELRGRLVDAINAGGKPVKLETGGQISSATVRLIPSP